MQYAWKIDTNYGGQAEDSNLQKGPEDTGLQRTLAKVWRTPEDRRRTQRTQKDRI